MDKKNRILAILYRLLTGEHISQKDLVSEYGVEERSIRRDIAVLRQFLSENRERVGDLELLRKNEVYYLNHTDLLSPDELLLVIKILIGSRVMDETKLQKLLEKLMRGYSCQNREFFINLFKDDMKLYRSAGDSGSADLFERVWKLEGMIRRGNVIRISYERLDNELVDRELYPVSVVFSEYYFYLIACRAGKEDMMAIYYRLDRIKSMKELDQKACFGTNGRYGLSDAKRYSQNMFMGKRIVIRFVYTGPSIEAILDKFPTAKIVRRDEEGVELTASVEYSRGTIMELLSQGSWIRVLKPDNVVKDIQNELRVMKSYYTGE